MTLLVSMVKEEHYDIPLRYGRTDGVNVPNMIEGKFFTTGYNPKYGLMDVCEDNGEPIFEGRVNIERLLSETRLNGRSLNLEVDQYIASSYNNLVDYATNPENYEICPDPILEVLTDKRN